MTIVNLRQRLDRLEASSAPPTVLPGLHPLTRLLDGLVAGHLGDMGPHSSIAEGMARAMGYDGPQSFRSALMSGQGSASFDDMNTRRRDAISRLFAIKGKAPDCDGETFAATLEALYRELPDRLREHPFMAECEGLFEAA